MFCAIPHCFQIIFTKFFNIYINFFIHINIRLHREILSKHISRKFHVHKIRKVFRSILALQWGTHIQIHTIRVLTYVATYESEFDRKERAKFSCRLTSDYRGAIIDDDARSFITLVIRRTESRLVAYTSAYILRELRKPLLTPGIFNLLGLTSQTFQYTHGLRLTEDHARRLCSPRDEMNIYLNPPPFISIKFRLGQVPNIIITISTNDNQNFIEINLK